MKKLIIPVLLLILILSGCGTEEYKVEFRTLGGTEIDSIYFVGDESLLLPNDPTKAEYTFGGWYIDDTLSDEFNTGSNVTENLILYAKWIPIDIVLNEYIVTFNPLGGSSIDSIIVDEGGHVLLPEDPVKEGYVFSNWYYDETLYSRYMPSSLVNEDITLYAKWDPIQTGIYLMDGDSLLGGFYVYFDDLLTLPPVNIAGYTFDGWYTEDTFENEVTSVVGKEVNQEVFIKLTKIDFSDETIDLESLPYYEYLKESNPVITFSVKNVGEITLELFPDLAKNTVDNFISYIQANEYENAIFHRIIMNFMVQGGIVQNTSCPIKGDFSSNGVVNDLSHYRGVISMARTNVNDSATSQFFMV
ncbi:InlB B-repeat-containing protein, partial [Candidatus Izimaplasma bacterium]|nr:InlB B-repeat-containing protein [Candidatus Izimaplasma bacterium]